MFRFDRCTNFESNSNNNNKTDCPPGHFPCSLVKLSWRNINDRFSYRLKGNIVSNL